MWLDEAWRAKQWVRIRKGRDGTSGIPDHNRQGIGQRREKQQRPLRPILEWSGDISMNRSAELAATKLVVNITANVAIVVVAIAMCY